MLERIDCSAIKSFFPEYLYIDLYIGYGNSEGIEFNNRYLIKYLICKIYFCRTDQPSSNMYGAVRAFKGFNPERVERARGHITHIVKSSRVV